MPNITYVAKSLIVNPDGKALLLTRAADDHDRPGDFDLPGGSLDPGETYHEAASREIREETGLEVSPDELALVFTDTRTKGDKVIVRLLFAGKVDTDEVKLSHEHSSSQWVQLSEIQDIFKHPVWTPGISFAVEHGLVQHPSN